PREADADRDRLRLQVQGCVRLVLCSRQRCGGETSDDGECEQHTTELHRNLSSSSATARAVAVWPTSDRPSCQLSRLRQQGYGEVLARDGNGPKARLRLRSWRRKDSG